MSSAVVGESKTDVSYEVMDGEMGRKECVETYSQRGFGQPG